MPCVSLKHRRIYREQILPCIKTRIKTEKAAKSPKINQQPVENSPVVNQNVTLSSNSQPQNIQPATSISAAPNTIQNINQTDLVEPQLLKEGQEISLRSPKVSSAQTNSTVTGLSQINAELSNLDSSQPTAISSRNVQRSGGLRARFRSQTRPSREDLINAESRLGGSIFGPIPEGHRREFFHDQRNVWIWYEGWYEKPDDYRQVTIRYEVYPSGVYKKISAGNYQRLENGELDNFCQAARTYFQLVKQNLYQFV